MSKDAPVHWRSMLDSEVIRFADIIGQEFTLEIASVKKGKVVGKSGKATGKAMITFKGAEKPLAAGTSVLSVIAAMFGSDTRRWVGKSITIYGDPDVVFGGEKVGGVRVRPAPPKTDVPSGQK